MVLADLTHEAWDIPIRERLRGAHFPVRDPKLDGGTRPQQYTDLMIEDILRRIRPVVEPMHDKAVRYDMRRPGLGDPT